MNRRLKAMESVLKYPGGQSKSASWITSKMPKHVHYVEPFAGSLAVLLSLSPDGRSEVVNDLDGELTHFWRTLQDPEHSPEFIRRASLSPISQVEWRATQFDYPLDPVSRALSFFVRCRQSYMGGGKSFAPLSRSRTRRGMNEQAAAWLSAVDRLPDVAARLLRVVVFNMDARELMEQEDSEFTLFYCDPPYHPGTRTARLYACEMDDAAHRRFLSTAKACKGRVMISGYRCDLYDAELADWTLHTRERPNSMERADVKGMRTECLWCNF